MLGNLFGIIGLLSLVLCVFFAIKKNAKMQLLFVIIAIIFLLIRSVLPFFI